MPRDTERCRVTSRRRTPRPRRAGASAHRQGCSGVAQTPTRALERRRTRSLWTRTPLSKIPKPHQAPAPATHRVSGNERHRTGISGQRLPRNTKLWITARYQRHLRSRDPGLHVPVLTLLPGRSPDGSSGTNCPALARRPSVIFRSRLHWMSGVLFIECPHGVPDPNCAPATRPFRPERATLATARICLICG